MRHRSTGLAEPSDRVAAPHIAFIVSKLDPGGAERVAVNLAEAAEASGLRVDLVLISRKGDLLSQVPKGVRIIDLNAGRARNAVPALRNYLRSERPHAMVAIAFHVNLLAVLATIGLKSTTRLILTVHNTFSHVLSANPPLKRVWLWAATRILYRFADEIVAVSKGVADDLAAKVGLASDRVRTIHNPVLRQDFDEWVREEPDHPWLQSDAPPTVIAVGRLMPQKDYPTLIRAFAQVASRSQSRLIILGEGHLRADLESLVEQLNLTGRVAFVGYRSNPYPYMKAASVFVLSSRWEGFGNVLVEAMATGTPVISTDCMHGPREILEGGKWGKLVPPGDPDSLADAILDVLTNGGVDASRRARDFTVQKALSRYLELAVPVDADRCAPRIAEERPS